MASSKKLMAKVNTLEAQSQWNRKVVVDTNVILFDGLALLKFEKSDIHIPFSVIEEIDRFKRDLGETGRNARQFQPVFRYFKREGFFSFRGGS